MNYRVFFICVFVLFQTLFVIRWIGNESRRKDETRRIRRIRVKHLKVRRWRTSLHPCSKWHMKSGQVTVKSIMSRCSSCARLSSLVDQGTGITKEKVRKYSKQRIWERTYITNPKFVRHPQVRVSANTLSQERQITKVLKRARTRKDVH